MTRLRLALTGTLLAVTGAANAGGYTLSPAVTSDYDFRGLTQSAEDPAFQLGGTLYADSGLYVGAWGSYVAFQDKDAELEVDAFVGYSGGDPEDGFGYDVGAIVYYYPRSDDLDPFAEAFAGISKGWFGVKAWYSPDRDGQNAIYVEGNATIPLPYDFQLLAHGGYSFGDYWKDGTYWEDEDESESWGQYADYSIGIGRTFFRELKVEVKYVRTSLRGADTNRVAATLSTTLPWGRD